MQHRKYGVHGLVFGGLMAALAVVCALVPFLSVFMPIPLIMAYVRYGGRIATLTGIVAVLFSALFVGPVQAFLLLVPSGILPGLALGFGFRHKKKPLTTMLIAVLVFFLGFGIEYFVARLAVLDGQDPIASAMESPEFQQVMDQIDGIYDAYKESLESMTITSAQQEEARDQAIARLNEMQENMPEMMILLLPSSLFILGAASSWFNYLLCRWILPRFGMEVPAPTPFEEFRLPVWLTWVMILLLLGTQSVKGSLLNAPWQVKVLINLSQPLMYIFVLVGFAVAYGWLRKRQISKPAAVLIIAAVFLFLKQSGLYFYLMLAMWDTVFDFRGLGYGLLSHPRGVSRGGEGHESDSEK